MRVECHDMGEDAAEREGLRRFAQSVDERIIPGGAVSDVTENTMQFSIRFMVGIGKLPNINPLIEALK
jgi:hypothetical protein